jgi:Heterokaryon incompatibility protein (HET)
VSCRVFTAKISQKNEAVARKIYRQLQDNEIRLIRIHSGDGPIRCNLIQTSEFTRQYSALSYVWGPQDEPQTIFLNGKIFHVTQNLHEALLRLRSPSRDRVMWIDALAINQCDLSERSLQVLKMAHIYSNAEKTLIWLGESRSNGKIWLLGDGDSYSFSDSYCPISHIFSIFSDKNYDMPSFVSALPPEQIVAFGRSFDALLSLSYWKRVWVVQEIMHSQRVTLLFGPHAIPFYRFRISYEAIKEKMSILACSHNTTTPLQIFRLVMNETLDLSNYGPGSAASGNLINVDHWLDNFCPKRYCSDPRDKIFGFYSCFVPGLSSQIVVDYTKSTIEVFSEMVQAVIRLTGHLEIINEVDRFRRETIEAKNLPSWVPNFAGEGDFLYSFPTEKRRDTPENVPAAFYEISNCGTVLHVKGVCIGVATLVSDILEFPQGSYCLRIRRIAVVNHFLRCLEQLGIDRTTINDFFNAFLGPRRSYKMNKGLTTLLETPNLARDGPILDPPHPDDLDIEDSCHLFDLHRWRPMFMFKYTYAKVTRNENISEDFPEHVAIGHPNMIVGDKVYAIPFCTYPVIIRNVNGKQKVVGTTYQAPYNKYEVVEQKHRHLMESDRVESLYLH